MRSSSSGGTCTRRDHLFGSKLGSVTWAELVRLLKQHGFEELRTGKGSHQQVVPNIMQGDPTRQNFRPLVYVPFRQELPAVGAQSSKSG